MSTAAGVVVTFSDDEKSKIKKLLQKGIKIPPQPRVLTEIRDCIAQSNFDFRSLVRVISQDPGLVAMLFKAASAAVYRDHHPFTSIEQILKTLGVTQAFNLVQGAALLSMSNIDMNPKAYETFWTRSVMIAQLAMLIAEERVTVCNIFPEQAYLAGIFHDCGVPLLIQRFPAYGNTLNLSDSGGWTDLSTEDRNFDTDHSVVGYVVGRYWHLPDFICQAILCHHDMLRLENHEARTMVAILQLAINLYHRLMHVSYREWPAIGNEVLNELCIHEDSAEEYMDDIRDRFLLAS